MTVRLVNKSDKLILLEIYDLSEVHQVDVRQEDWPVQGDGEEVKDWGGAAEDVTGGPDVTEEGAEYPGTTYLIWVILEFLLTIDMGEVIWKSFKAFRKKVNGISPFMVRPIIEIYCYILLLQSTAKSFPNFNLLFVVKKIFKFT